MEAMRNANDEGSQHTSLPRLSDSHTALLAGVETLTYFKNTGWVSVSKLLWGASLVPIEQNADTPWPFPISKNRLRLRVPGWAAGFPWPGLTFLSLLICSDFSKASSWSQPAPQDESFLTVVPIRVQLLNYSLAPLCLWTQTQFIALIQALNCLARPDYRPLKAWTSLSLPY